MIFDGKLKDWATMSGSFVVTSTAGLLTSVDELALANVINCMGSASKIKGKVIFFKMIPIDCM
jgi:hypothetical protein